MSRTGVLTTADVDAVLAGRLGGRPPSSRNRALVALFAYCGLRVQEALGVKVSDVSPERDEVRVGDGGTSRIVAVPPQAAAALREWLDTRGTLPEERLFATGTGVALRPAYVRQMLSRMARAAGLPSPVGPETLRRFHVWQLLIGGWRLCEMQQHLGYRSVAGMLRFIRSAGLGEHIEEARRSALVPGATGAEACDACLLGDGRPDPPGGIELDSAEAVLVVDHDGVIVDANPVAHVLLAVSPGALVGTRLLDHLRNRGLDQLIRLCETCLAERRPARTNIDRSAVGGRRLSARVVPKHRGLMVWMRDDLALTGLPEFVAQLSALAHGGRPGTTVLVRVVRDAEHEIQDFIVAAVHSKRPAHFFSSPEQIAGRRASEILPAAVFRHFLGGICAARLTGRSSRGIVRLGATPSSSREAEARIVPLAGEWLVLAVRDV